MSKSLLVAAALLLNSAPALAQIVIVDSPPVPPPTKSDQARSDWDKIQCRSEGVTGSRLERHQVCLTRWQWWAYEQEAKQRVQQWQIIGFTTH